jgi:aromatic ring-opening dioxygenase catalytic subunit (LigB family)
MYNSSDNFICSYRDEGVLIIGSGAAVHNLHDMWNYMNKPAPSFVKSFDQNVEASVVKLTVSDCQW